MDWLPALFPPFRLFSRPLHSNKGNIILLGMSASVAARVEKYETANDYTGNTCNTAFVTPR